MSKRTPWTEDQKDQFRDWHIGRMKELNYPPEIVRELQRSREKWLLSVRTK
jgi:hypothetical protein